MSAPSLPPSPSLADWPSLRRAHHGWAAAMKEICARHGWPATGLAPAGAGTSVVFTTHRHVIKLYPPFWQLDATAEWAILGHVDLGALRRAAR